MKILFITDSLRSGGAERVLVSTANEFIKIGYQVSIFSKSRIKPFYSLSNEIRLIYPTRGISYKNKLVTIATRCSVYFSIYKNIKIESADVVISFSTNTNGVSIILSRLLRVPIIACEHSNYKNGISTLSNWFIKRFIYPHSNALTVLTQRDLEQFYIKFMRNVYVLPNSLDSKMGKQSFKVIKKEKIILAIGNINRWKIKGFDNLLIIFSSIVKKHPEWILKIAGDGDKSFLENLIKEYNLKKNVVLLGEVRDIPKLMHTSTIFVLTSRYEGLPMVILEAMSQGLPCIAFDCFTGPSDIITDMFDGILVSDQNIDEYINKLNLLIEDEKLRIRLGMNAINTAKKYEIGAILPKWQKLIEITAK